VTVAVPVAAAHSPVYVRHVVFHFDDVLKELNGNLKLYKRRDRVPSRDRDASSALKDAIGLMSWRLSMGKFAGRLVRAHAIVAWFFSMSHPTLSSPFCRGATRSGT